MSDLEDTRVSLRHYVEALFRAQETALTTARAELERRLEGMNEFREQLQAQKADFASRTEMDLHLKVLQESITALEKTASFNAGRMAQVGAIVGFIAAIAGGLIVAVLTNSI